MAGRVYTVTFENVAVTAAQDLWELTPASNKPIRIIGIMLGQNNKVGDANENMLRIQIIRGFTTSGSGGTAPTPNPINRSDAAAGFTAEVNNTTLATTGTTKTLWNHSMNIRVGEEYWFPEGCGPDCSPSDTTIVVRLLAAPAASTSMDGTLYVEEMG